MIKRLALFISTLVALVLLITTGIYFAQSKSLITEDMNAQADIILRLKKNGIDDFLIRIRYLMLALSENSALKEYFEGKTDRQSIEKLFTIYAGKMSDIQAMRLIDLKGNIVVFWREGELVSAKPDYKPIYIGDKDFFQLVSRKPRHEPTFSDFERGHLPDAVSFCPSMIRSMLPIFEGDKVIGYLIVNLWGKKLGETASQLDTKRGYSFIVEINGRVPERNGVFIFHPDHKYEFANQFGTEYFFDTVYGKENFKTLLSGEQNMIPLKDGFMFYSTYYPYEDKRQAWKICTVMYKDYFFQSLTALRHEFIGVMLFCIILSILTAAVFSKYFMRPFAEIKKAVTAYSCGDFDYPLDGRYTGEIDEIAKSIRSMADSLKVYIEDLKNTQMRMELMNRLSALGVMAGGIAHELNTPLNSIIILTKLLKQETGDNEDLATIEHEAKRCVDIIENLKKLAPDKEGNSEPLPVHLKDVIEKTLKYINTDALIETDLDDVVVSGFPTLLQQMVLNLVQNGLDSLGDNGRIRVKLERSDGYALLSVSDNGCGIPKNEIDRIFDPFHTTKAPNKGMGLGLSLVHKIVKKHGGQITVESEEGEGTEFNIRLELRDESSSD
ncbi:sensor histidine kinase [Seleniivibrio sp.]|uniref:sensor histidine kinase n=1 Tax=Seleniivibrio sp. TaxID=2898801 RepID=UPI0025D37776|nr:sensor histidine kinase [Seleniivibrio sp.]MCD8552384.1 sensor histidine kinase [Seleniivibrio sp.]